MVTFTVVDFEQLTWNNHFISDSSLPIDKFEDQDDNQYYVVRNYFQKENRTFDDKEFVLRFIIGAFAGELMHGNIIPQQYFIGYTGGCDDDEPRAVFSAFTDVEKHKSKHRLKDFYELEREENESILEFCKRFKMDEDLFLTCVLDYICGNLSRRIEDFHIAENELGEFRLFVPTFCNAPNFANFEKDGIYELTGKSIIKTIMSFKRKACFSDNLMGKRTMREKLSMLNNVFEEEEIDAIQRIVLKRFKVLRPAIRIDIKETLKKYKDRFLTTNTVYRIKYVGASIINRISRKKEGQNAEQ